MGITQITQQRCEKSYIFEYTRDGDLESLERVLSNKSVKQVLQMRDDENRTLLHWAAYLGYQHITTYLLDHSSVQTINALDVYGYTALHLAAIGNYHSIISLLYEHQATLSSLRKDINELHWACYHDNIKLVEFLLHAHPQLIFSKSTENKYCIDFLFCKHKSPDKQINSQRIFIQIVKTFFRLTNRPIEMELSEAPSPQDEPMINRMPLKRSLKVFQSNQNFKSQASKLNTIELDRQNQLNHQISKTTAQQSQLRVRKLVSPIIQINSPQSDESIEEDNFLQNKYPRFEEFEIEENIYLPQNYEIHHHKQKLTQNEQLELRMLYWSAYIGNVKITQLFLRCHANPFVIVFEGESAFHGAASQGRFHVLRAILTSILKYKQGKIRFEKLELINSLTRQTPQSALHLAVESEHIGCISLLLQHGASHDIVNFRSLMPFDLTRERKILNYYNGRLKLVDPYNFVQQGYLYVLKVPARRDVNECIVRIQLMNIRQNCSDIGVQFDFAVVYTPKLKMRNQKKVSYLVIRLDSDAIAYWANELDLRCYNLKKKILMKYDIAEKMQFEKFKDLQVQQIIYTLLNQEFDVNVFMYEGLLLNHFPLHDMEAKERIKQLWEVGQWSCLIDPLRWRTNQESLRAIHIVASYYGPKIGWYFSFLCQQISWLLIPTIPGIITGIYMVVAQQYQTAWMPIYSLFMNLWATLFLEGWKRRQNELAFIWDMSEFKHNEPVRYQYSGQYYIDEVTHRIRIFDKFTSFSKRVIMDGPLIILGLLTLFGNFFIFQLLLSLDQSLTYVVVIGISNGIVINILAYLYRQICKRIVQWENHQYESQLEMSYVFKIFIFEFFNSYLTPGYLALFRGDYYLLTTTVASIIITRGVIHNLVTNVYPYLKFLYDKKQHFNIYSQYLLERMPAIRVQRTLTKRSLSVRELQDKIDQDPLEVDSDEIADQTQNSTKLSQKQLLQLQEQLQFNDVMVDNKDLIDEYMYLAIQFGYITMFSPVFPIAPLFAMANIYVNLKMSLHNYQHTMKREGGEAADSIGIWVNIFQAMSYFSTVINCIIIWTTSGEQLGVLIGEGSPLRNAIALFIIEHIIVLIKYALDLIIPDEPQWVTKGQKRSKWLAQKTLDQQLHKI